MRVEPGSPGPGGASDAEMVVTRSHSQSCAGGGCFFDPPARGAPSSGPASADTSAEPMLGAQCRGASNSIRLCDTWHVEKLHYFTAVLVGTYVARSYYESTIYYYYLLRTGTTVVQCNCNSYLSRKGPCCLLQWLSAALSNGADRRQ